MAAAGGQARLPTCVQPTLQALWYAVAPSCNAASTRSPVGFGSVVCCGHATNLHVYTPRVRRQQNVSDTWQTNGRPLAKHAIPHVLQTAVVSATLSSTHRDSIHVHPQVRRKVVHLCYATSREQRRGSPQATLHVTCGGQGMPHTAPAKTPACTHCLGRHTTVTHHVSVSTLRSQVQQQ